MRASRQAEIPQSSLQPRLRTSGRYRNQLPAIFELVHLVSISTEGYPHDSGKNMSVMARNFFADTNPHFQSVDIATPRELSRCYSDQSHLWEDFRSRVTLLSSDYPGARFNPVWAAVGFLGWKVLAIQHVLTSSKVAYGETLLYQDMDYVRYPSLNTNLAAKIKWLEAKMGARQAMFFSDYIRPFRNDIRPDLLFDVPGSLRDAILPMPLWAGALLLRKTPIVEDFLAKWLGLMTWKNLQPFTSATKPRNFIWHSGEQSILNLMYLKKSAIFEERQNYSVRYLWQSRDFKPDIRASLAAKALVHSWLH